MDVRNIALTTAATLLALVAGIAVAGYLTVPNPQLVIEGGDFIAFDPEVGMVARPSHHARRIEGATPNRPPLIYDIYTDDRGARVDGPTRQMSPARAEIVTIGCSFSFGHPIANEDTYAARVGRDLGVANSNFALVGYGTTQSLLMLKRNRDLAPKLVIYGFIDTHIDRNVEACAPAYHPFCMDVAHVGWDDGGPPRIVPPLSDGVSRAHVHLAGDYLTPWTWLAHGVDVIWGRLEYAWYRSRIPDHTRKEEAFNFLMRGLEKTVADMGATLLVVYIPANYQAAPAQLARNIGSTRLLDLTAVFVRDREAGGEPLYVVDDGHPTAHAHALIAEEIERYIRREGLLSGPAR